MLRHAPLQGHATSQERKPAPLALMTSAATSKLRISEKIKRVSLHCRNSYLYLGAGCVEIATDLIKKKQHDDFKTERHNHTKINTENHDKKNNQKDNHKKPDDRKFDYFRFFN
jgi:hypothetical protein